MSLCRVGIVMCMSSSDTLGRPLIQGSAQNLLRGGKKGQNSLCLHHFSIEKRWLKWLGGGKCRPVWEEPWSYGGFLNYYGGQTIH